MEEMVERMREPAADDAVHERGRMAYEHDHIHGEGVGQPTGRIDGDRILQDRPGALSAPSCEASPISQESGGVLRRSDAADLGPRLVAEPEHVPDGVHERRTVLLRHVWEPVREPCVEDPRSVKPAERLPQVRGGIRRRRYHAGHPTCSRAVGAGDEDGTPVHGGYVTGPPVRDR